MRISDWSSDVCSSDLKRRQDAEALARLPDGSLLVAFEREHRLRRLPADLGGRAEAVDAPPGLAEADINAGIEALVPLADRRLLALTASQLDDSSSAVLLPGESGAWPAGWPPLRPRPGRLSGNTEAAPVPASAPP